MKYRKEIKQYALELYKLNFDKDEIINKIYEKFKVKPSRRTIERWISEYNKKQQEKRKETERILKELEAKKKEEEEEIEEKVELEKEKLKRQAYKSQTRPDTAVDRIIKHEVTSQASEIISEYIALGKELKERFEEKAKRYGFSNLISYFIFLDEFYEKHKFLAEDYESLKSKYNKLYSKYIKLKLMIKNPSFLQNLLFKALDKKTIYELKYLSLLKSILES